MKTCSRCKNQKPITDFNFKKKDLGIRQKACKECTRLEVRKHYEQNRQYYLEKSRKRNKKQRKITRRYIFEYLSAHPCIDCGESNPIVLEFDHKSGKLDNVSRFLQRNYPLDTIKKEIKKCEIRCANCHRKKTAKDYSWYKYINSNTRPWLNG
jgi:hypothetical protein